MTICFLRSNPESLTFYNMRPNAIIVSLGLAILQAEGCHPILVGFLFPFHSLNVIQAQQRKYMLAASVSQNTVASDNTSTIHFRDVAPTTTSDAPANSILATSGPVGIDVRDGSPIRKGPELSSNANKRETIGIIWQMAQALLLLFTQMEKLTIVTMTIITIIQGLEWKDANFHGSNYRSMRGEFSKAESRRNCEERI